MRKDVRRIVLGGATASYDPAALAIFAAFTTPPTAARKQIINNCVVSLKQSGAWSLLDTFYMMAAADSQAARVNWKNPGTFTLSPSNSPAFATDRGYKGDGSAAVLTASGYNPSTAGLNFSLNSAMFGAYVRQAAVVASGIDIYLTNSRLQQNSTNTAYQGRVNDATALSYTYGTKTGNFTVLRSASNARRILLDGSQIASDAAASTSISSNLILFGTGATAFSDAQLSYAYTGAGTATNQNIADMTAALLTYLQAVGAA